jgi:hypothetical protein
MTFAINSIKGELTVKHLFALLLLTALAFAQDQAPPAPGATSAFPTTTVSLSLSPIMLPGTKGSVAGAETDVMIAPSNSFQLGETTVTGASMLFVGGRGNYVIKPVSTYIQNHSPNLNGYQFQFYLTGSVGVVKPVGSVGAAHWGERAGAGLNYAINGTWGTGLEAQWGNFPGTVHNTWTLAFGPNLHF